MFCLVRGMLRKDLFYSRESYGHTTEVKIVYTIDYSPWSPYSGGAQSYVHFVASEMSRRGHEVTVVYTRSPADRFPVPATPYRIEWATFFAWRSVRKATFRPFNALSVAGSVGRLAETSGADVVHGNGEEAALIRGPKDRQFGLVITPHYGWYPAALLAERPLGAGAWLHVLAREPRYLGLGVALRRADHICTPSRFSADLVARAYDLDRASISVAAPGLSEAFLGQIPVLDRSNGPVVFFGRFSRVKGLDILLDAIEELAEIPVRFVVVGRSEGDRILDTRLHAMSDRVEILPWLDSAQLVRLLAGARLVVSPSRFDNAPITVIEAQACATPVIAARVGGLAETILHEETGLLISPEDPAELADAIRHLLENPDRAREMGSRAAAYARHSRTWAATCNVLEEVYDRVLRNRRAGEGH
jgi:D-inositol-3-phosphate glycosyltransferase